MPASPHRAPAALALAIVLVAAHGVRADSVYLALGDSLTFGYDPSIASASTIPSYGDQGFVAPFANFLATQNGGVRPDVLNLAIPGELSTTFLNATPPTGWTLRAPQLNLNYANATTPQNTLMQADITAEHAAGNSIGTVSLLFGTNNFFSLVSTTAYQTATPAQQAQMVAATLATIQSNYITVLNEIKAQAPEATIILPNYYDPYPAGSPYRAMFEAILARFNPMIQADAALYNAKYADFYTPFQGNELALTNIASGDVHPNEAGYAVLGQAMILAFNPVPEPASLALLTTGFAALFGLSRRIPRRAAA